MTTTATTTTPSDAQSISTTITPEDPAEVTAFVESILQRLQSKMDGLHSNVMNKLSDVSTRVDELEKSLGEWIKELEQTPAAVDKTGETGEE